MELNEYDQQREERIRRNRAMLAKLQIQEKAGDIAAPLLAAQQQKEAAKEAVRKKYVPIGPARQSKRTGAQRTRAKLQQQAQDTAEGSDSEHSGSSLGEEDENDDQPEAKSNLGKLSQKRKRHAPEIDFDPADMASQSSSGTDEEASDISDDKGQQTEVAEEDAEDMQLQQALVMSLEGHTGQKSAGSKRMKSAQRVKQPRVTKHIKETDAAESSDALVKSKAKAKKAGQKQRKGKTASRVGLINPTAEEMKTAFSQLNPHNRTVISMQDISRVALEHGYNFDEDELNAMMEVAASVTERASTTSMTFQAFQKLVEHYSATT